MISDPVFRVIPTAAEVVKKIRDQYALEDLTKKCA
jgi:hypothetical protein